MKELFIKNIDLSRHLQSRPPEYLAELERCVVRRQSDGFFVDTDSPVYLAMVAKYRPARQSAVVIPSRLPAPYPISADFDFEAEKRRLQAGGCCGAPSAPNNQA